MNTKLTHRKLGNTVADYTSGSIQTMGMDRHLATTAESLHHLTSELPTQSRSQPSSHKKKKATGRLTTRGIHGPKDAVKKLQYNLIEDNGRVEEDIKMTTNLQSYNLNSKGKTVAHPSISKYTNNPYKATSTLSFYNQLNPTRALGKNSCLYLLKLPFYFWILN